MHYSLPLALALGLLLVACQSAPSDTSTSAEAMADATPGAAYQLVWSDEFDGEHLDTTKWNYNVGGHGWGNNELQFYTDARPENARLAGGTLRITAIHEPWEGKEFTSARLTTKGKADWTYGRFEIRAKLPSGVGTWPAIWLLYTDKEYGNQGWPDNGEIDIMEEVGYDPDVIHSTIHDKAFNHSIGTQVGDTLRIPTARSAFHVYRTDWTPDSIISYIDDQRYFAFGNTGEGWEEWPFDHDHHLLLNVAVGGNWGGQQGVDTTAFPTAMEVDYVRVYQQK
ncbi:Glycosyl hydrolases family 16 [Catalinimonas alkaloidigena]|uniref:Glycosyl hydrolases family 16 n=1 Tax=Catalinimonas alkaloidigena TaxID=1075417 RepID=A0A1G9RR03_9BACT|nr:glycoside hydrolase family 16 protein [Catalinimonas alkaloidigena]SDM25616.1 Glycosyl hydrolases family 16 [Catalinimonas alkaloidigena]